MYTYKNPWYSPSNDGSRSEFTTEKAPTEYLGYQLFFYYPGRLDIVKNGVALTQRACKTLEGGRKAVDMVLADEDPLYKKDFTRRA